MTQTKLILVHPLGFSTASRHLKRAGLDYWEGVDVKEIEDLEVFLENTSFPFFFFSSKAKESYIDAPYAPENLLVFGSESEGLPPHFFDRWPDRFFKIPMKNPEARCLNLATSVGIVLFESLRVCPKI